MAQRLPGVHLGLGTASEGPPASQEGKNPSLHGNLSSNPFQGFAQLSRVRASAPQLQGCLMQRNPSNSGFPFYPRVWVGLEGAEGGLGQSKSLDSLSGAQGAAGREAKPWLPGQLFLVFQQLSEKLPPRASHAPESRQGLPDPGGTEPGACPKLLRPDAA